MSQKLINIINHYKRWKKANPDTWLMHCKNQKNLSAAIHFAAFAKNNLGKRHPHQYRLKRVDMETFETNLLSNARVIRSAQDFETLLTIVDKSRTKGIGELAIYDTAIRIGSYLNLEPDKIYLHAGTRT